VFALRPILTRPCRLALYGDTETSASGRVCRTEIASAVPPGPLPKRLVSHSSSAAARVTSDFPSVIVSPSPQFALRALPLFLLLLFALLLQGIECSGDFLPFIRTKIDLL
jgi:hypothetical protein